VSYDLTEADQARISIAKGPVIVVANHPFGGIEGIILASILRSVRSDVKLMANFLLNCIPEMNDLLIPVNPFKNTTSVRDNIKPVRESIQWVKNGGMLVVFPAGAVSHFDIQKGAITDPPWSTSISRIIKKTEAPVLPVFFRGTNSAAFHIAGMVHPLLRTAMLPNELFNKNYKKIHIRVGDLIPFEKLDEFEQDRDLTKYLRLRTYLLELQNHRHEKRGFGPFPPITGSDVRKPIQKPRNSNLMVEEINKLPQSQMLIYSSENLVIQAEAAQIPNILNEIGRLREITFRAVGEGTGKSLDLDQFDDTYVHLFVWNRDKCEVVGAYRIGKTDELIRKQGVRGLYTSTLFHYKKAFFERLGPSLELGRSFVRPEYQKSYTPLLLLWKGIARFIVENPRYKTLFGPVSITDDYASLSKQLIVEFLKTNRYKTDLARFVRPQKPLRLKPLRKWDIDGIIGALKDDSEHVSDLIACIEEDRKGIPVLLKQYLKLGGQIVGFNVDPAFGHVLDGLILVNLLQTDSKILERYLGKDGARQFTAYHESLNQERLKTCA
jgi:putative hemolysin